MKLAQRKIKSSKTSTTIGQALLVMALILLPLTFTSNAHAIKSDLRIVGGSVVKAGEFPFVTMIWFDANNDGTVVPFCAGTLIDAGWIMSAAHCFSEENAERAQFPERLFVSIGSLDLTGEKTFTGILSITVHPDYNPDNRSADIALLKLDGSYSGDVIATPSFSSVIPQLGEMSTVVGWGRTSEEGENSVLLLDTNLPVRSHIACTRVMGEVQDRNTSFCAGGEATIKRDSCKGDSGGPLLVQRNAQWVQAGIVNFGFGCARPGISGLYTRVSHYADWLIANTGITTLGANYDPVFTEPDRFTKLQPNNTTSSTVAIGQVDIYEVTGFTNIDLFSNSGDADLYIYGGDSFETSILICESNNEMAQDSCSFDETNSFVYAGVFGYVETNDYSISGQTSIDSEEVPQQSGPSPNTMSSMSSSGGGGGSASWIILAVSLYLWSHIFNMVNIKSLRPLRGVGFEGHCTGAAL